jgi:UDP-N-acetylmuramate dehydrogenase
VVREDEPMAAHTSWKVGGPADLWVEPADEADLAGALATFAHHDVRWLVLGKGSNTLFADAGFRGAVVSLEAGLSWIREEDGPSGEARLAVGGGTAIAALLRYVDKHELAGLEMLAGIPGTVGGTVRMNGGTHLGELSDALVSVRVVSAAEGARELTAEALGFRYRGCDLAADAVVTEARFRVRPGGAEVGDVIRRVKERRRDTQPLHLPSGGSTFKNPPGDKAWRLLDAAGLRGKRIGGAELSHVHPNFIVNLGGASAADIAALIRLAQREVSSAFGVALEAEVHWLGDWDEG